MRSAVPRRAALALAVALPLAAAEGREQLIEYLNSLGRTQLAARTRAMGQVSDLTAARRRQAEVRARILRLIGGLPETRTPLNARTVGTLARDGFRIERVIFESQPGLYVTANVYVPAEGGPRYPAVILTPGHGLAGKTGEYGFAANFARNGILALAWDVIGQGERVQNFDPALGKSKVGGPTGEHGQVAMQTLLIGEHVSRYFIWDAMRVVDYLTERTDVRPNRIGAFGCSGGGTVTAYLAALDNRVAAAASGCYVTSFQELLPTAGPQEAEQTIPRFLEVGLDFADWVELAAPRHYAIVSTTEDMFPVAGAGQTYEEAKRFWDLFDSSDRVQWIKGPGRHGALAPIAGEILAFFLRSLKASDARPAFEPLRAEHPEELLCTESGQVSVSLGGETVASLNRKRAQALAATGPPETATVRRLTAATVPSWDSSPVVRVTPSAAHAGYLLKKAVMTGEDGVAVPGALAVPEGDGRKKVILLLGAGGELDRFATSGKIVLALEARPSPVGKENAQSPLFGPFNLLGLRAQLVGKTLLGMRIDDAIGAVNWLCGRPDADCTGLTVHGEGAMGVVALHAALLDRRIAQVEVKDTLASWRSIVDDPLHRNTPDVMVPGVLRYYDIPGLLTAIGPQRVKVLTDAQP